MKHLTMIAIFSTYILAGCIIVKREATTASSIGDIFNPSSGASKEIQTKPQPQSRSRVKVETKSAPSRVKVSASPAKDVEQEFSCSICGRKFPYLIGHCPYDGSALKPIEK